MPEPPERSAGKPADRSEEAAALLASAERPAIMAGTGLYWARGEDELRALAEALGDPGLPQRHGPRLPARRPRALLLPGARAGPEGGRRRPGGRRAARLPPRLRRLASARRPRSSRSTSRPASSTATRQPDLELVGDIAATLAALARGGRVRRRRPRPHRRPWLAALRETRGREARGRGRRAQRRPRPAAPRPHLQGAQRGARPRRDRDRRRRRLRLLRRPLHRDLRARHLDGPGPVRLPRRRARARRSAPRRAHPERQVCLLLGDGAFGFSGHGVRHDGPPRPPRRRDHRQQRHLGPRAPPDEVPLRLLDGGRAPPRDPLRPDRRGARLPRRARHEARTSCGRPSSAPSAPAARRWSTSSPTPRSSTRARPSWPSWATNSQGFAGTSAASAKGLPSLSRQIAHRSPGWITVPPLARMRSSVAGRSATVK